MKTKQLLSLAASLAFVGFAAQAHDVTNPLTAPPDVVPGGGADRNRIFTGGRQ